MIHCTGLVDDHSQLKEQVDAECEHGREDGMLGLKWTNAVTEVKSKH